MGESIKVGGYRYTLNLVIDEIGIPEGMGANVLMYEATLTYLDVFTRPWKIGMPLYRHVEANAQILEFRCVEFVEDLKITSKGRDWMEAWNQVWHW